MKNLKKVLALVVVFTMMLSTVAFAAYPDVAADADYATAVEVLSALEILQGDDQGNFNPDANITRAEFAAVVCRALGLEDSANGAKGATQFDDVAASHWATGYINLASQQGIINGYGDGNFGPEDKVTYEQAVKMLVSALGFEYMAQTKGGWPTGYLVVANQYGITKGVKASAGEPAARSIVAELTFNALDCPLMEQGTFGTEEEWFVYDGLSRVKKTLLSEKLEIAKLTGVVTANAKANLTTALGAGKTKEDKFGFVVMDNNDTFTTDFAEYANPAAGNQIIFEMGETLADKFFANKVDLYVEETSKNVWTAKAIVGEEGKNIVLNVSTADVDETRTTSTAIYYEATENASTSTKLDVTGAVVTHNNNPSSLATLTGALAPTKTLAAGLTLIDWDNNLTFDAILVNEYAHAIVDSVNVAAGIIRTKTPGVSIRNFDLALEDDSKIVTLKDVEGNDYALEDIAEDDVLAIISDNMTNPSEYTNSLDIIVIPAEKAMIEGTVSEIINNGNTNDKVYIDGEAYKFSAADRAASRIYNESLIDANSVGTFYLSINGDIIGFDGSKAASGNYAFILETGIGSGLGAGAQMKVLTADGEVATYTLAETVIMPMIVSGAIKNVSLDIDATTIDFSADLAGTAWAGYTDTDLKTLITNASTNFDAITTLNTNDLTLMERFVKINTNSAGKINRIELPGLTGSDFDAIQMYENSGSAVQHEYKEKGNKINGALISDNAKVFVLDSTDLDASTVKTSSEAFTDESKYGVALFDETNGYYDAVLVVSGMSKLGSTDGIAIVTGVTSVVTEEGNTASKVRFIQDGSDEEKAVVITTESTRLDEANADLAEGSLFLYTADANGEVDTYAVLAQVNVVGTATVNSKTYTNVDYIVNTTYIGEATTGSGHANELKDTKFVYGYIQKINGSTLSVEDTITSTTVSLTLDGETNEYYYKYISGSKYDLTAGAYQMGRVDEDQTITGGATWTYVFAKVVDGDVVDIVALDSATGNASAALPY